MEDFVAITATFSVFIVTVGIIATSVMLGTRYINRKLRLHTANTRRDDVLVRPLHPSGGDWKSSLNT
jgi:hypothetical protein